MNELIVAAFEDTYTAFLARAALARLQKSLSLSVRDVAVITREEGDDAALPAAIDGEHEADTPAGFWRTLVDLLFIQGDSAGPTIDTAKVRLAAIGLDAAFRSRVDEHVRPGTAALFVLVNEPVMRDQVLGVLRGFQGAIARASLTDGDRDVWRHALSGRQSKEGEVR